MYFIPTPLGNNHKLSQFVKSLGVCPGGWARLYLTDALVIHLRTHTLNKHYESDVCQKPFFSSGHLAVHRRRHTGVKPYECDVCKFRFSQSSSLTRHKKTHIMNKAFRRDLSMVGFSNLSRQTSRKRTHNGDKHKCDICKV